MIKVISLIRRAEGMSKDEFVRWVRDEHLTYAKAIPGLRRYTVSITTEDDTPFDSANELWFDDEAALTAGFATEAGQAAGADAAAHASERVLLVTTEYEQQL